MNTRNMFEKIKEVKAKSGKNSLWIFCDMINCGFKYQAGYMDYALFEMYNLNKSQRKTVVTRGINNSFIKRFNNPQYRSFFDDKRKFDSAFEKFIGRDWLDIENCDDTALSAFLAKHPEFMAKPPQGMCGKGIEKLCFSHFSSFEELKAYLKNKNLLLLEEIVIQHPVMSGLHPHSVNTCRVITLLKDHKPNVVAAYLRIGNGKFVDNFNSAGMVVPVDENRGEVLFPALNKQGDVFDIHPLTGVSIKGFKVPMWDEVLSLAKSASLVVPQVGLVGWDVAVTEKGPLIIEGNDFPGHDIYGLPQHRVNGVGVLPKFERILNT